MRFIIVSNRLPVTIFQKRDNSYLIKQSVGGLATGLNAFLRNIQNSDLSHLWVGWAGINNNVTEEVANALQLQQLHCHPVNIPENIMNEFYGGFCNESLWPLFHDCWEFYSYNNDLWENYKKVNEIFCKRILQIIQPDDVIWIHDYHLLYLAKLLRQKCPHHQIGFFLHIPFPSPTTFANLPRQCRNEILKGMLGADLIGFHTEEYRQNFISCVEENLKIKVGANNIVSAVHQAKVNVYPMGIDFEYFQQQARNMLTNDENIFGEQANHTKIMLSVDRLDYTKGIVNRINAYGKFLEDNETWRKKISLVSIIAPSRDNITSYKTLKKEIDEAVGKINGRFGDMEWTPITYMYRAFTVDQIIKLYALSDIGIVTPIRDGMNLVAKEYIAAKINHKGVLILSEKAGAACELTEALLVKPTCINSIAIAMKQAVEMSEEKQQQDLEIMHRKLQKNNIVEWGKNFLGDLLAIRKTSVLFDREIHSANQPNAIEQKFSF